MCLGTVSTFLDTENNSYYNYNVSNIHGSFPASRLCWPMYRMNERNIRGVLFSAEEVDQINVYDLYLTMISSVTSSQR